MTSSEGFSFSSIISAITEVLSKLPTIPKDMPGYRKRLIDEYITPAYTMLIEVHMNYISIFSDATHRLLESTPFTHEKEACELENDIKDAHDLIIKRRKEFDEKRDKLRADISTYLNVTEWMEEKRFLLAVYEYFILDDGHAPVYEWKDGRIDVDSIIESLREKTGITYYETPTTGLIRQLREVTSRDEALNIIDSLRYAQNQKFVTVSAAYLGVTKSVAIR